MFVLTKMKKSRKIYRGIVLGCGIIGVRYVADEERIHPRSHAEALRNNLKTELVGLVDPDPTRLREAGDLFPKTKLYSDAEEALKLEKPDIVVIATPPKAHTQLVKLAVRFGGKMIICEKPLAPDAKHAISLMRALHDKEIVFVLNFQRRFFSLFEKLRNDIAEGTLGTIQQVTGYYDNGLYNTGAHIIDSILYLLGERITKASGLHNKSVTTHPPDDPDIDGILETSSGTRIALQGFNKSAYGLWELRIYGSKGAVILHEHGYSLEWRTPTRRAKIPVLFAHKRARKRESFVKGSLNEAITCYEQGLAPRSGFENGIEVLAVLDALKESSRQNGKVVAVETVY